MAGVSPGKEVKGGDGLSGWWGRTPGPGADLIAICVALERSLKASSAKRGLVLSPMC